MTQWKFLPKSAGDLPLTFLNCAGVTPRNLKFMLMPLLCSILIFDFTCLPHHKPCDADLPIRTSARRSRLRCTSLRLRRCPRRARSLHTRKCRRNRCRCDGRRLCNEKVGLAGRHRAHLTPYCRRSRSGHNFYSAPGPSWRHMPGISCVLALGWQPRRLEGLRSQTARQPPLQLQLHMCCAKRSGSSLLMPGVEPCRQRCASVSGPSGR